MTWFGFAGTCAFFFASHMIPVRPAVKTRLVSLIGKGGFTLLYSALSVVMLLLLIRATAQAPYVQIWPQLVWQRGATQLGMLFVCLILALALARPNPFSFGGMRNGEFDSDNPGIVRISRHPVLMALALWAFVHLLPNGDLAHVLLFGLLGGFAVVGQKLIDRRKQRELGTARWNALRAAVRQKPLLRVSRFTPETGLRLSLGLAGYTALALAHPLFAGLPAF